MIATWYTMHSTMMTANSTASVEHGILMVAFVWNPGTSMAYWKGTRSIIIYLGTWPVTLTGRRVYKSIVAVTLSEGKEHKHALLA